MSEPSWWRTAVGYEVYLRSFSDSDGDGIGDLPGLRERLDHLAWLGVDLLWVTPFFTSPMHDHGYDVADYRNVDPTYGTLADFDGLVADAHELRIRVLVELIPNHSSSEHPWFRESRSSRDNPYRDYYLWRDPAPGGGPPNNWVSVFGGPAWTFDEATGQYWLHLFISDQPDLNWRDERVVREFDEIMRFWLDRGVDGFRVDVADALLKHPDFPDNPASSAVWVGPPAGISSDWGSLEHLYDVGQPGVRDIHRRWGAIAEEYDALLLGEIGLADAQVLARFVNDQDGLHLTFWLHPMEMEWDPATVRETLSVAAAASDHLAWVQGSHDRPRAATRFGGGDVGRSRSLALAVLMLGLPGVPFVYQGEELGLENGLVRPEEAQDPISTRSGEHGLGRDSCRTPMPWEPGPGLGFTTAERAWLPFGGRTAADTAAVQRDDPDSMLQRFGRLLRLRGALPLASAPLEWLVEEGPLVAYRRGTVLFAANCGDDPATLELPPGPWTVAYSTVSGADRAAGALELAASGAVVLVSSA